MAKRNWIRHMFVPIAVVFWIFGWFLSFVGERQLAKGKQPISLTKHIVLVRA